MARRIKYQSLMHSSACLRAQEVTPPFGNVDPRTHLVLQSNETAAEGTCFSVEKEVAMMSMVLRIGVGTEEEKVEPILIAQASASVLRAVLGYMEHHHDNPAQPIPMPLQGAVSQVVSEWDRAFLEEHGLGLARGGSGPGTAEASATLAKMIDAANYLQIDPLLELLRATFASLVIGKSANDLASFFSMADLPVPGRAAGPAQLRAALHS